MHDFGWTIPWHRGCTAILWSLALTCTHTVAAEISLAPASMPRIGSVDERFQSYNIEMVEVTGGPFWKPYDAPGGGTHSGLFSERKPKDLGDARLRSLAAALSPAFMRVSGTWANATYFAELDHASTPPAGFKTVLTRREWQGVIDFSRAVDAPIVTSFAISAGTRNAAGIWMPEQARDLLAATRSMGGRIAAVELMNEPDLAAIGGAPEGYDAAAYARDFAAFSAFMRQAAPKVMIFSDPARAVRPMPQRRSSPRRGASMPSPITTMGLYRRAAADNGRRMRRSSTHGWHGPTTGWSPTARSAIASRRESRSGSPRPRKQPAAAIPGAQPSSTHSATSISSGDWRGPVCRSSCTIRLRPAIMACSTNRPSYQGRTTGARCYGDG